jgi:hypothetical protein
VALSSEYIARAFSQALGHIGNSRANLARQGRPNDAINVQNLARRLYNANRNVPGANHSSYAAVARRAVAAEALAREMSANPAYAPGRTLIPQVDTLYPDQERYRYHVAVTYTGRGGNEAVARGEVLSDKPLSGAEIEAQVRQRIDYSESVGRSTKSALARVGPGRSVVDVVILAATRIY